MSSQQGNPPPPCFRSSCSHRPVQLQFYQAIIFAAPVLFASILLLLFCILYFRRLRGTSFSSHLRAQSFIDGLLDMPPLEQGLSKSFRQGLPVIVFNEKFAATSQETQCAVCLGDYQENEKLLQLPVCKHSFHVQCIDEWLAKNATCPICRSSLHDEGRGRDSNSSVSRDANSMVLLLRADENRMWEERVVSEAQEGRPATMSGLSIGASSSGGAGSSESTTQHASEHAINIERS